MVRDAIIFRGFAVDPKGTAEIILNNKHRLKGKWVYGDLRCIDDQQKGTQEYIYASHKNRSRKYLVVPETVSQFTGKYAVPDDCIFVNKEDMIFGGDIIGIHQFLFDGSEYERELIGQIVYDQELLCWAIQPIEEHAELQDYMGYEDVSEFCKERIAICMLHGLHEDSFRHIKRQYEV